MNIRSVKEGMLVAVVSRKGETVGIGRVEGKQRRLDPKYKMDSRCETHRTNLRVRRLDREEWTGVDQHGGARNLGEVVIIPASALVLIDEGIAALYGVDV